MKTKATCDHCGNDYEADYGRKKSVGRRKFCSQVCYRLFNAEHKKEGGNHAMYSAFKRRIWGSTGLMQGEVGAIRSFDYRKFELIARDSLMEELGFSDTVDMNQVQLGFSFDFIANIDGKKVLVDVTTKYATNAKIKKQLADLLSLDLYYLFISPEYDTNHLYYLHKMTTPTFKIPHQFFKDAAIKLGIDVSEYFMTRPEGVNV